MSKFGNFGGGRMFPPVVKGLLIANISIFILQQFFFGAMTLNGASINDWFIQYFALWPFNFQNFIAFSADNHFYPWQLITYQFMHGDIGHIFMNMFALWMFGNELENTWGPKRFLLYYILTGIGAAIIHMAVTSIMGNGFLYTVGASGSVYGILLAYGMTFPNRPIFMFPLFIPIQAKYFVMIYAAISLLNGFTSNDNIAHFAHLGGALTGFLMLKYGRQIGFEKLVSMVSGGQYYDNNANVKNLGGGYTTTYTKPKAPIYQVSWNKPNIDPNPPVYQSDANMKKYIIDGEEITQVKIDIILDKISATGYQNLTEREKFILTELSKKL
jgi:membrane associated rhomboid family serine protease